MWQNRVYMRHKPNNIRSRRAVGLCETYRGADRSQPASLPRLISSHKMLVVMQVLLVYLLSVESALPDYKATVRKYNVERTNVPRYVPCSVTRIFGITLW